MKAASIILAIVGSTVALPQTATDNASPTGSAPAGCTGSVSGPFQVAVQPVGQSSSTKRDLLQKRTTCDNTNLLEATLNDTVLKDAAGRTGYIASNYQFQFDGPPQAGAIYTAGFSLCDNSSLALGDSTVWYQCLSGDFYNLYNENWATQCEPIELVALHCNGSQSSEGEPVLNANVSVPICQISDGQVQAHTTACITMTTGAPQPGTTANASIPATTSAVTTTTPSITVFVPSTSTALASGASYNATVTTGSALNATQTAHNSPGSSSTATAAGSSVGHMSAGSSVVALAVGLIAALWAV